MSLLQGSDSGPTDLSLLVHAKNATKDLGHEELAKVFRAEDRYWSDKRRIELLLPRSGSPERQFLLERVYRMSEAELKRHWIELVYQDKIPAPPRVMPSSAVGQAIVAKQEGAITILPTGERRDTAEVVQLRIDGKQPGDEGYWARLKGSGPATPEPSTEPSAEPRIVPAGHQDDDDLALRVALLEQQLVGQLEGSPEDEGSRLHLQGFADVTFGADFADSGDSSSSFALGQVDLFMTARLSDRIHALSEVVFETDDEGETITDLERLVVTYEFGDRATLRAGRLHTSLGWWNTTYHHGEWLQTTIERPRVVEFEDDGGILPVHLVGLSLELSHTLALGDVELDLQLGNGRGPTPDPPQAVEDANDSKAVNLQLGFHPRFLEGLSVGAGGYIDHIPANADAGAGPVHGELDEVLWNAFVVWNARRGRIAGEFFSIAHEDDGGEARSHGAYLQAELDLGEWRPYLRGERLEVSDQDTFFASQSDSNKILLGVRWDLVTWNALKFQVEREYGDEDSTAIVMQSAFAF